MENKASETVTQFDQDKIVAIMERQVKRWVVAFLVTFLALVGTNIGWIVYEAQFEETTTLTQDVDTGEAPAYVNGTGEMTVNGEGETNNH